MKRANKPKYTRWIAALALVMVATVVFALTAMSAGEEGVKADGYTVNVHLPSLPGGANDDFDYSGGSSYSTDAYFTEAAAGGLLIMPKEPALTGAEFVGWATDPAGGTQTSIAASNSLFLLVDPMRDDIKLDAKPDGLAITDVATNSSVAHTITLGGTITSLPGLLDALSADFPTEIDTSGNLTNFSIKGLLPVGEVRVKQTNPALVRCASTSSIFEDTSIQEIDGVFVKEKTYTITQEDEAFSFLLLPGENFTVEVTRIGENEPTITYTFANNVTVADAAVTPAPPPAKKAINLYAQYATVKYHYGTYNPTAPNKIATTEYECHDFGWSGASALVRDDGGKAIGTFRGWFKQDGSAFTKPDTLQAGEVYEAYAHYRSYYLSINGVVTGPFAVTIGDYINTPQRPGAGFTGWFTAAEEGVRFDFYKTVEGNGITTDAVTLFAQFSDAKTVIFLDAYGKAFQVAMVPSGPSGQTIEQYDPELLNVLLTTCRVPQGFMVSAWYLIDEGESYDPKVAGEEDKLFDPQATKVTADLFVRPYIETGLYYVMFHSEGTAVAPRVLRENSALGTMPTSVRTGYTFAGWKWDADNNAATGKNGAEDDWMFAPGNKTTITTVTATITIPVYPVSGNNGDTIYNYTQASTGGNNLITSSSAAVTGMSITPGANVTGFSDWNNNSRTKTQNDRLTYTVNGTQTTVDVSRTYTITRTWNNYGRYYTYTYAVSAPTDVQIEYQVTALTPADTTLTPKEPGRNVTLYAQWTPNTVAYTIQYWREKPNHSYEDSGSNYLATGTVAQYNAAANQMPNAADYIQQGSVTGTALAGSTIPLATVTAAATLNGLSNTNNTSDLFIRHFNFDHYDSETKIAGNGDTVINVYYKRNIYRIEFNFTGNYYNNGGNSQGTRAGLYTKTSVTPTATYSDAITPRYSVYVKYEENLKSRDKWPMAADITVPNNTTNKLTDWVFSNGNGGVPGQPHFNIALWSDLYATYSRDADFTITVTAGYDTTALTQWDRVYYAQAANDEPIPTPAPAGLTNTNTRLQGFKAPNPANRFETIYPVYVTYNSKVYVRQDNWFMTAYTRNGNNMVDYSSEGFSPTAGLMTASGTAGYMNTSVAGSLTAAYVSENPTATNGAVHYYAPFYDRVARAVTTTSKPFSFNLMLGSGKALTKDGVVYPFTDPNWTGNVGDWVFANAAGVQNRNLPDLSGVTFEVDGVKYSFDGWYSDPSFAAASRFGQETTVTPSADRTRFTTSDIVVYANWVTVPFTVKIEDGYGTLLQTTYRNKNETVGGTDINATLTSYMDGTTYPVVGDSDKPHIFRGWQVSFEHNSALPAQMLNESLNVIDDLIISATWAIDGNPYRVEYENAVDRGRVIYGFAPASDPKFDNANKGSQHKIREPMAWSRGAYDFAAWSDKDGNLRSPGETPTIEDDMVSLVSLKDGETDEIRLSIEDFLRLIRGTYEGTAISLTDFNALTGASLTDAEYTALKAADLTLADYNEVKVGTKPISGFTDAKNELPVIVNIITLRAQFQQHFTANFYYERFELDKDGNIVYDLDNPDFKVTEDVLTGWRPVAEFLSKATQSSMTTTVGGYEFIVSDEWYRVAQKASSSSIRWGINELIGEDHVIERTKTDEDGNDVTTLEVDFFAHWMHLVKFDLNNNGGYRPANIYNEQYVEHKATISSLAAIDDPTYYNLPASDPANQKKKFIGWFTAPVGGELWAEHNSDFAGKPVTTNMTLYAQWDTYYTLTYHPNGGTGAPLTSVPGYLQNTVVTGLKNVTDSNLGYEKPGYVFSGWSYGPYFVGKDDLATATVSLDKNTLDNYGDTIGNVTEKNNITLYAVWTPITLTYDPNGGAGSSVVVEGLSGTVTLADHQPVFSRRNHTFLGWSATPQTPFDPDAADGGIDAVLITTADMDATALLTPPNVTVYAVWKKVNGEIKVQYWNVAGSADVKSGGLLALNEPTGTVPVVADAALANHTFLGWYYESKTGAKKLWNFATAVEDADTTDYTLADGVDASEEVLILNLYARYARLVLPADIYHIDGYTNKNGLGRHPLELTAKVEYPISDFDRTVTWTAAGITPATTETVTPTENSLEYTVRFGFIPRVELTTVAFNAKVNGIEILPNESHIIDASLRPIG
ncbi:hypothetical protein FACS1894202_06690 [Clostridia bacterium]|nr:hypothetical protein FACS1894202_06690 [Clostridia bacterium]